MDTLNIGLALWRNKIAVGVVLLLTGLAVLWAFFLMPITYQVETSLLLLPPPAAPGEGEIQSNPSLAKINSDNPYARSYDPTILIALISREVTSPKSRAAIEKADGDERFTVVQASSYGFGSPFADITAMGSSPQEAVRANELVVEAFRKELVQVQAKENFSTKYYVTLRTAGEPTNAKINATEVGGIVIKIIGLAVFGLFAAVSISDALREARRRRADAAASPADDPHPRTPLPLSN